MLPRRHFIAIAASCSMTLIGCERKPTPPSPETRHRLYDKAWQWGRRDRLLGLSADSSRYQARLAEHLPAFGTAEMQRVLDGGYANGFNQHPEEEMGLEESAYDKGYRQGQLDAWARKPSADSVPRSYSDGFSGMKHKFNRLY